MAVGQADEFNAYGYGGTAVSGTTVYRSAKTSLKRRRRPGYQLIWTGTPTGTFVVQVTARHTPAEDTDTDWTTVTLATPITQPAGSAANDFVGLDGLEGRYVRMKYTNASGSGTINAYFHSDDGL